MHVTKATYPFVSLPTSSTFQFITGAIMNSISNESRSQLVNALWRLKQANDNSPTSELDQIHFNLLLKDEGYRQDVLDRAVNSTSKEIQRIALQIRAMNLPGNLLFKNQDDNYSHNSPLSAADPFAEPSRHEAPQLTMEKGESRRRRRESSTPSPTQKGGLSPLSLAAMVSGFVFLGILIVSAVFYAPPVLDLLWSKHVVKEHISAHTTWKSGHTYTLDRLIYVENGARLSIEPGVTILGNPGAALIISKESSIYAKGTAEQPIVFTSSAEVGQRKPGDWGGLVMLGKAPINKFESSIEGVERPDRRTQFGGRDANHNCGVLEYVRIEFAGYEAYANNELNGLTVGGCGSDTIIRHVQVHRSLDDGIEMFGGNADLRNIVVTGAQDDSFDWDMGWTGRVQYLVIQAHPDAGDNGFEGDNAKSNHNASPRSQPSFFNVTMVASPNATKAQRAITLRRGSAGHFHNMIITGYTSEAIDLRGPEVKGLIDRNELTFSNISFFRTGPNWEYFQEEVGDKDDDNQFIEKDYFRLAERSNHFDIDPRLPSSSLDVKTPAFVPAHDALLTRQVAAVPQGEFWDEGAKFRGALKPGQAETWLDRWTAFPAN